MFSYKNAQTLLHLDMTGFGVMSTLYSEVNCAIFLVESSFFRRLSMWPSIVATGARACWAISLVIKWGRVVK